MSIEITSTPKPENRYVVGSKRSQLRNAIALLRPGTPDSFDWPTNRYVYSAAYSIGAKVLVLKNKDAPGFKIWRVS